MKLHSQCAVVTALTSMLALALAGSPQDSPFTLRVNVAVVSLESVVIDPNGRPVTTLKREDFTVYEDGGARPIQSFSSVEAPYSIILLFQNTPSVYGERTFMADASNTFLKALRPQDRVSIYMMEQTMRKALDWRNAQNGKVQEVKIGLPFGNLFLYGSVAQAFDKLSGVAGRKGVIVMTDGEDTYLFEDTLPKGQVPSASEDKRFQKTLQTVKGRGIPLYFVAINTDRNLFVEPDKLSPMPLFIPSPVYGGIPSVPVPPVSMAPYFYLKHYYPNSPPYRKIKDPSPTVANDFLVESRARMEVLAEVSGGQIYFPKSLNDVVPLYEQIAKELGTSYSFGYTPHSSGVGTTHRIEVRVSDPKLRVIQSRQSYTTR